MCTEPECRSITAEELIGNTQWDTNAGPIDVLIAATGPNETFLMYADIQPRSIAFKLGGGQTITAASLDDVIRMKDAADRFKDQPGSGEARAGARGTGPFPVGLRGFEPPAS
jgi:hypothetical protein